MKNCIYLLFISSVIVMLNSCCKEDPAPIDNALLFDGVDDYVDLGSVYDGLQLPVTISVWVWLDPSVDGTVPIFDSHEGLPSYNGFNFLTSNSALTLNYGDGIGENNSAFRRAKSAAFDPLAGRWVNLTGVVRGATDMSLYYNGVDIGGSYVGESNQPMFSNSPEETAKIGLLNQNGGVFRFKGKLDELRIWNRSLSKSQVQETIFKKIDSSSDGLIGYWDFNENGGDQVIDKSLMKFNGILKGGVQRVPSEVPVE